MARLGGARKSGEAIVSWATRYLEEYHAAVELSGTTTPTHDERLVWTPPADQFKVNVDGAIFSKQRAVGLGVTVRDDKGRLEAAMTNKIHTALGAVQTEAKAFEMGLQFARDIGVQDVILEGDSDCSSCFM